MGDIIGILMIALLFGGIFTLAWIKVGLKEACWAYGVASVVITCLAISYKLING